MSDKTTRFDGFSSAELLRRARVLRDIAEREPMNVRADLIELAFDHEEAARKVRTIPQWPCTHRMEYDQ